MRGLWPILSLLPLHACFVSVDDFPVSNAQLGDACDASHPCGPGLDCWADAPGGICTRACANSGDCPEGSTCVDAGGRNACMLLCDFGDGDGSKCRSRRELGCTMQNACVPMCSSDAHCPGRYCNRKTGLCSDTESTGQLPPKICTALTDCRGACSNTLGVCEEGCVLGSSGACSSSMDVSFGCVDLVEAGAKVGDVAQCGAKCSCATGCGLEATFKCKLEVGGQRYCVIDPGSGPDCLQ